MNVNKKTITTMLTLTLMISMFAAIFSVVNAHDPPWTIPTYAYIGVSQNPMAVNAEFWITMWIDKVPPTAGGDTGDRWNGFKVDITRPDGTQESLSLIHI